VSAAVRPVKSAVPVVLPVLLVDAEVVVFVKMIVLDAACGFGVNVTVIDVVVVWLSDGAAGFGNCGTVRVRGADTVPTGEFEKDVPSPIDVTVASKVSPAVSPVKWAVPDVLPESVDCVEVVVSVKIIVLDVACGSGVKVAVMDVVVVWLNVGAAGLANCVSASVTEEEGGPAVDDS
jgi:hypothetical protein